jgi:cytidylate kinase
MFIIQKGTSKMVFLFFGPSCSGKSTVAEAIAERHDITIWTGKDYLKLAKNSQLAWNEFVKLLQKASDAERLSDSIIYIVTTFSDIREVSALPESTIKIRFFADVEALKARFSKRLNGTLPPPIENMLISQLEDSATRDYVMEFDTTDADSHRIAEEIIDTTVD